MYKKTLKNITIPPIIPSVARRIWLVYFADDDKPSSFPMAFLCLDIKFTRKLFSNAV